MLGGAIFVEPDGRVRLYESIDPEDGLANSDYEPIKRQTQPARAHTEGSRFPMSGFVVDDPTGVAVEKNLKCVGTPGTPLALVRFRIWQQLQLRSSVRR